MSRSRSSARSSAHGPRPRILRIGVLLGGKIVEERLIRDRGWTPSGLAKGEWPWLLGAIVFGGVLGPLALMFGLTRTTGAAASLLLNLEAVLTAVIAWVVFKENADRRIVLGMLRIPSRYLSRLNPKKSTCKAPKSDRCGRSSAGSWRLPKRHGRGSLAGVDL